MEIFNSTPPAAKRAFEQAHQQRPHKGTRSLPRQKQTTQRDYRLSSEYREFLADERQWRKDRNRRRADIRAINARTYLHTQATPKLTARRLDMARLKAAADKVRIQRARSPERQQAKLQRELNTACYEILVQRRQK